MTRHLITDRRLSATINADGAELCSLRDAAGTEFLWSARPPWPRHAPVLFPIVGRLAGDRLLHEGQSYRLTQHGFARDRTFTWTERSDTACGLLLEDDEKTRALYPFPFRFELRYAVSDGALTITFAVTNTGTGVLPASMGAHPAFVWPLHAGLAKTAHTLRFAEPEPAPIRRLEGGLLKPDGVPTPIQGRDLPLREDLFTDDAIVMDRVASRSVRFAAAYGPAIDVSWSGFRELGIWMKPGGDFLCIEPWLGTASPAGFDGAFIDKPGLMLLDPGERREASMAIRISSKID